MWKLKAKGYRLADPSCSNATQGAKSRWKLTLSFNNFTTSILPRVAGGSHWTASLFDTESSKEVWRDTPFSTFGRGRLPDLREESIREARGQGNIGSIGEVLAKFEKRKKVSQSSPANLRAPMSVTVRIVKAFVWGRMECDGVLKLDSGTLSFEPIPNGKNEDKCADYRFSWPGARVKGPPQRVVIFSGEAPQRMLTVPGKG